MAFTLLTFLREPHTWSLQFCLFNPSERWMVFKHVSGRPSLTPVYFTKRLVGLFDLAHVRSIIVFFFFFFFLLPVTISNRIKLCPNTRSHPLHTGYGTRGWLLFFWGSQWTMCFTSSEQIPFQPKTFQRPQVSRPDCTSGLWTDPASLHVGSAFTWA